jgi:predicted nuclease of predicted toxin-antitoxin system
MRFIVDAQLPRRLARWLASHGHDVLHTLELPNANATPDAEISDLAYREGRIVVSKDGDFVDSHLVQGRPIPLPTSQRGQSHLVLDTGSRIC